MRFLIAGLFLSFASVGAAAAATGVSSFRLANGMEVVVIEDHRAPVVTHMVWYRVGAADEPPGRSGIAHFLEHLMFKGTPTYPDASFSRIVAENGGRDNAFTTQDYTAYFQRIAAGRLPLVMRMEADRMRNLVLTDEVVLPERDVILEERNSRVDTDPGSLFSEQRDAALYLNSPYGIPVIGWRHEIEQLTRRHALEFYARYYAPNNAILIVAGDVAPDRVRELAETHYGPVEPTPGLPPRIRPQEPPQLAARRLQLRDPKVRQPYVVRAYLAPERNSGDQKKAAALRVLAELLGGRGVTSELGSELQLGRKLAVSTGAFYDGLSVDRRSFGVYVVPSRDTGLAEAEEAMDEVLARFIREGPDQAHLERVKKQIRADQIFALDNQESRSRKYGGALAVGLTVADIDAWPDVLQSVTAEEVRRAAEEVLVPEHSVTGWLMGASAGVSQ
ncbi:MAG: M16 family metallopeptidase [Paracoccaceae bacterium]